jgi:hypothetical protein
MEEIMLFLNICTWEPGQRTEILKRRAERGIALSEGVKFVGEWADLNGRRSFLLVEANDPKAVMASVMVWSHLMKMEIVPVIEAADLWKGIEGKGSKK